MFPHTVTIYNHYRTPYGKMPGKRTYWRMCSMRKKCQNHLRRRRDPDCGQCHGIHRQPNGYVPPTRLLGVRPVWHLDAEYEEQQDAIVYGECTQEIIGNYLLDD
jgi:hypothetical protein